MLGLSWSAKEEHRPDWRQFLFCTIANSSFISQSFVARQKDSIAPVCRFAWLHASVFNWLANHFALAHTFGNVWRVGIYICHAAESKELLA
jgi:hypothetical protein